MKRFPAGLAARLETDVPDCVVTYHDTHMLAVLGSLRTCGLVPGVDVGVASFDNTSLASLVQPAITSMDHHTAALAEECVRLILERTDDPGRPWQRSLIPPTLVVRASTAFHGSPN